MAVTVSSILRFPVKGLSADVLAATEIASGQTVPFDRMYAVENGPGPFDEAAPRHLPKVTFLCLMRDERLAGLHSTFDTNTSELALARGGIELARGSLATADGRATIEAFLTEFMAGSQRGRLRIVSAAGHSFSDVREMCVHIINLASVRALEAATGRTIDPLRFRANVVLDGMPPWAELDLAGREAMLGTARVAVFKRTVRCAATNVDPVSAVRDGDLPGAIFAAQGHRDFGVYATVIDGGTIRVGDRFEILAGAHSRHPAAPG